MSTHTHSTCAKGTDQYYSGCVVLSFKNRPQSFDGHAAGSNKLKILDFKTQQCTSTTSVPLFQQPDFLGGGLSRGRGGGTERLNKKQLSKSYVYNPRGTSREWEVGLLEAGTRLSRFGIWLVGVPDWRKYHLLVPNNGNHAPNEQLSGNLEQMGG